MKKIILPTDFSDNARNAIEFAFELLKEETCTFYLVNTYTPAIYQTEYVLHSPGQIGLGDIYQTESIEQLEELQKQLEKQYHNPKHKIIVHSAFNILVDEILDMVEKEDADMVIMGTQGASGAKEILLGTHTVHVIKKATFPVLAIPSDYDFKKPDSILFPSDFEVAFNEVELKPLLDIADLCDARIHVLHMTSGYGLTEEQKSNKKLLADLLGERNYEFHDMPNEEIISGINKFQQTNKIRLLAMVKNKHTFLERLFIEPIIKKIGFHVTIPFMVIPHN